MNNSFIFFNNTRVEAIIFDMDGTIVANRDYHLEAWRRLCRAEAIPATDEELLATFGCTNREIFGRLCDKVLTDEETERLSDLKESLYREAYSGHVEPTAGLTEFMKHPLMGRLKKALATSAPTENVIMVLRESGLGQSFQVVTDASVITRGKPHPEIFLKTAAQLDVDPKHCLVFEDAPHGISAARAAGMEVIALATTFSREQLPADVVKIDDFNELFFIGNGLSIKK